MYLVNCPYGGWPDSKNIINDVCVKILSNGIKLEAKDKPIFMKLLGVGENINKILDLQEIIEDYLGENKGYIVKKKYEDFYKLSDYKDKKNGGFIMCAFSDENFENLIATDSVSFHNLKDVACDENNKISYNPDLNNFNIMKGLFENKGLMVHPEYHGYSMGKMLFSLGNQVTKLFFPKNKTMLMTEIAVGNNPSLISSYKCGFKALKKYIASDGVECFLLYKPLSKKAAIATGFDKKESIINFSVNKKSKIKISDEEKNKLASDFKNQILNVLKISNCNNVYNYKTLEELYKFQTLKMVNDSFSEQEKISDYFIE